MKRLTLVLLLLAAACSGGHGPSDATGQPLVTVGFQFTDEKAEWWTEVNGIRQYRDSTSSTGFAMTGEDVLLAHVESVTDEDCVAVSVTGPLAGPPNEATVEMDGVTHLPPVQFCGEVVEFTVFPGIEGREW
jgi:hypothetical protein